MPTAFVYGVTVVWALLIAAVVADWRGVRSRRPYAYPLVAVGGLLYVGREWVAALDVAGQSAEVALAVGSNLAFLAALVLFAWRWWGLRGEAG